jgi:hypothetical protein
MLNMDRGGISGANPIDMNRFWLTKTTRSCRFDPEIVAK